MTNKQRLEKEIRDLKYDITVFWESEDIKKLEKLEKILDEWDK